jgi:hypothetical protein
MLPFHDTKQDAFVRREWAGRMCPTRQGGRRMGRLRRVGAGAQRPRVKSSWMRRFLRPSLPETLSLGNITARLRLGWYGPRPLSPHRKAQVQLPTRDRFTADDVACAVCDRRDRAYCPAWRRLSAQRLGIVRSHGTAVHVERPDASVTARSARHFAVSQIPARGDRRERLSILCRRVDIWGPKSCRVGNTCRQSTGGPE